MSASLLSLLFAVQLAATQPAPATAELTRLLDAFLAGASTNDTTMHERFWAEDLIYTGSSGRRISKADIMKDVRSAPAPGPTDPRVLYAAEDVRIQQYGETALVAFRLVATQTRGDSSEVSRYLNTGFFVRRKGERRASGWQATKVPPVSP